MDESRGSNRLVSVDSGRPFKELSLPESSSSSPKRKKDMALLATDRKPETTVSKRPVRVTPPSTLSASESVAVFFFFGTTSGFTALVSA